MIERLFSLKGRIFALILKKIIYILLFFSSQVSLAQYEVDYTPILQEAYNSIIHLDFDQANKQLGQSKIDDPNNLAYLHLENYIDFFRLFIYEDKEYFEKVKSKKAERIELLEQLEDDDPYKNFVIAEINLQWALTRSKFDELFKAGREIYAAYKLLEENTSEFPDFIYNYKSLSIIHSLVETISVPGFFKNIFGMSGSIEQGLNEIYNVTQFAEGNDFIFSLEAEAIYIFMALYQDNNQKLAFDFLKDSNLKRSKSPLAAFVQLKLLQRAGRNDEAIVLLLETLSYTSAKQFPYLYFLMGVSHLRKLNEESSTYFNEFLDNFDGLHYIKEAHQKLAWASLIFENDVDEYNRQMKLCLKNGQALIDDDKQAVKEANRNQVPNPTLLQARLLFDGGYYQKAYQTLITNSELFYQDENLKLEYYYRLGRITQSLKNYPESIQYYFQTISADTNQTSYMSCNAALNLGIIYESQNDFKKAKKHFNQCISMSPDEYQQSLHQKAKTGLNRIQNNLK